MNTKSLFPEIKFVLNIAANALLILGIAGIPSAVASLITEDSTLLLCFAILIILSIIIGGIGRTLLHKNPIGANSKLSYVTLLLVWFMMIFISSIPFHMCDMHYSIWDSIFESTAGWTTTGASSIDFSTLPIPLQLWRATLNWMGGIGIIVLVLTILKNWRFQGKTLAAIEIPGTFEIGVSSTYSKGYRYVFIAYIGITVIQFAALIITGMDPFTSLLTTLSNTSTAGMQHINSGLILALPMSTKVVITIFAFLGSLNCSVFILFLSGRKREAFKNGELTIYVLAILISTIVLSVMILLSTKVNSFGLTIAEVSMQVVSFFSTAGYMISDFNPWPMFCKIFLCMIMFIGACSFSTSGGIKISRVVVSFKTIAYNLYRFVHPSNVKAIKFSGKLVPNGEIMAMNSYIILFMITFMFGGLLLTANDIDIYTSINISQAMITNMGVSISELSNTAPLSNYSPYAKMVMSLLMVAGRLEIYPILMLFSRTFWSGRNLSRRK